MQGNAAGYMRFFGLILPKPLGIGNFHDGRLAGLCINPLGHAEPSHGKPGLRIVRGALAVGRERHMLVVEVSQRVLCRRQMPDIARRALLAEQWAYELSQIAQSLELLSNAVLLLGGERLEVFTGAEASNYVRSFLTRGRRYELRCACDRNAEFDPWPIQLGGSMSKSQVKLQILLQDLESACGTRDAAVQNMRQAVFAANRTFQPGGALRYVNMPLFASRTARLSSIGGQST